MNEKYTYIVYISCRKYGDPSFSIREFKVEWSKELPSWKRGEKTKRADHDHIGFRARKQAFNEMLEIQWISEIRRVEE